MSDIIWPPAGDSSDWPPDPPPSVSDCVARAIGKLYPATSKAIEQAFLDAHMNESQQMMALVLSYGDQDLFDKWFEFCAMDPRHPSLAQSLPWQYLEADSRAAAVQEMVRRFQELGFNVSEMLWALATVSNDTLNQIWPVDWPTNSHADDWPSGRQSG